MNDHLGGPNISEYSEYDYWLNVSRYELSKGFVNQHVVSRVHARLPHVLSCFSDNVVAAEIMIDVRENGICKALWNIVRGTTIDL
jgi:hypothetical protein